MKKQSVALVLLLALSSASLLGEVKTFRPKGMDVSKYETYQWMPVRILTKLGIQENDDIVAPEIKKAVSRELQRKGYREVAEGGQLQVLAMGLSEAHNQLEGFLVGWGWEPGWGWAPTTATAISQVNREGTLAIGLVDAKTKKPVWSGFASEALHPEKISRTVDNDSQQSLAQSSSLPLPRADASRLRAKRPRRIHLRLRLQEFQEI